MSTEYRDNPPPIDYSTATSFVAHIKAVIATDSLVLVRGFPPDKQAFADFSSRLGTLMPTYRATGSGLPDDYVQEVRIRSDIPPAERLSTERDGELKPHTAKSWGITRPRLFGLLMIDPGWTDQPAGNNGESILVRWQEAFKEMADRFPDSYKEDWELLKNTQITFTATHLQDLPATEPLVAELGSPFDISVRYKENMLAVVERMVPNIPNGKIYFQAVSRFEEVVRTTVSRYEFPMKPGDLYFVDNRKVAHARRPFESTRVTDDGKQIYNPRCLFNIHILD